MKTRLTCSVLILMPTRPTVKLRSLRSRVNMSKCYTQSFLSDHNSPFEDLITPAYRAVEWSKPKPVPLPTTTTPTRTTTFKVPTVASRANTMKTTQAATTTRGFVAPAAWPLPTDPTSDSTVSPPPLNRPTAPGVSGPSQGNAIYVTVPQPSVDLGPTVSAYKSIYRFIYLPTCLSTYYLHTYLHLHTYPSTFMFTHLPIYLPTNLRAYLYQRLQIFIFWRRSVTLLRINFWTF